MTTLKTARASTRYPTSVRAIPIPSASLTLISSIPPPSDRVLVVRGVVEERELRAFGRREFEDVETGQVLLQAIAITARVHAHHRRDEQPVGRLVRDDQHRLPGMIGHDLSQR